MEDCIFCKIAGSEAESHRVYEDDEFVAFLDIRPLNPGHTLVVPRKHYRWVWDVPNIGEYYKVVRKIAQAMKKAFDTELVVSLVVGEAVPHAHVWLVPRLPGDGHGSVLNFGNVKELGESQMKKAAEKIKIALSEL
jgi:histidine triad (HIT) family protein